MTYALNSKTEEATKCRIFIGNLPSDKVTKESMRQIFSQYGSYVDCSIYKNFGFVQFNDEKSAQDAVKGTDKTKMFERLLDVKVASMNVNKSADKSQTAAKKRTNTQTMPVAPLIGQNPYDPNYANYDASYGAYGGSPGQKSAYPTNITQPTAQNMTAYPYNPYTYTAQVNPIAAPFAQVNQIPTPYAQSIPPQPNLNGNASYSYNMPSNPAYPEVQNPTDIYNYDSRNIANANATEKNDNKLVDIICYNKKLFQYGEFIEFTMSKFGLICNINILFNNYPVEALIKRCARESACAIILKEENETHRSISLHIFGSNPEEHRNMPIDVAESFLKKKFNAQDKTQNNLPTSRSFSYSVPSNYSASVVSQTQAPIYSTAGPVNSVNPANPANYAYSNQNVYPNQYYQNYAPTQESSSSYYPSGQSSYNTGSQNYYPSASKYGAKSSGYKRP